MIGCELCSSARGAITPWAVGGVTRMLCGACRSKYPQDDDSSERDELAHLRTALATAERELAEARRERDSERSHHEELSARYHTVCRKTCESLRDQVAALTAERDTLRAEVERLKAAGAWKPEEVWREDVADEAAEQIAAWLDSGPDLDAPGLQAAASAIRAGSWRKDGAR